MSTKACSWLWEKLGSTLGRSGLHTGWAGRRLETLAEARMLRALPQHHGSVTSIYKAQQPAPRPPWRSPLHPGQEWDWRPSSSSPASRAMHHTHCGESGDLLMAQMRHRAPWRHCRPSSHPLLRPPGPPCPSQGQLFLQSLLPASQGPHSPRAVERVLHHTTGYFCSFSFHHQRRLGFTLLTQE